MSALDKEISALEARLAKAETGSRREIRHHFVEPIWRGDVRVGTRVWREDGIELAEGDPLFRWCAWNLAHNKLPPEKD